MYIATVPFKFYIIFLEKTFGTTPINCAVIIPCPHEWQFYFVQVKNIHCTVIKQIFKCLFFPLPENGVQGCN